MREKVRAVTVVHAVVASGVARLAAARGTRIPIVGGAGAYRLAGGDLEAARPVRGYDSVDVLHLEG